MHVLRSVQSKKDGRSIIKQLMKPQQLAMEATPQLINKNYNEQNDNSNRVTTSNKLNNNVAQIKSRSKNFALPLHDA